MDFQEIRETKRGLKVKYRIVQKRGHGGFWIQKRVFGLWVDFRENWEPANVNHSYAEKEWAENKIKELIDGPEEEVVSEYNENTYIPGPKREIGWGWNGVVGPMEGQFATTGFYGPVYESDEEYGERIKKERELRGA